MDWHIHSQVKLSQMEPQQDGRGFYKPVVPRPHAQEESLGGHMLMKLPMTFKVTLDHWGPLGGNRLYKS